MVKYVHLSRASLRSLPKTSMVVTFLLVFLSSFLMPALRLVRSLISSRLFGWVCLIWGPVPRPPIGGPFPQRWCPAQLLLQIPLSPLYWLSRCDVRPCEI